MVVHFKGINHPANSRNGSPATGPAQTVAEDPIDVDCNACKTIMHTIPELDKFKFIDENDNDVDIDDYNGAY